ncbi:hypothetical protein FRB99_002171 [Tulasnella sp. 403]|nr:hypothetical protein FRB99_002171 [Tulasnella sp. 403]
MAHYSFKSNILHPYQQDAVQCGDCASNISADQRPPTLLTQHPTSPTYAYDSRTMALPYPSNANRYPPPKQNLHHDSSDSSSLANALKDVSRPPMHHPQHNNNEAAAHARLNSNLGFRPHQATWNTSDYNVPYALNQPDTQLPPNNNHYYASPLDDSASAPKTSSADVLLYSVPQPQSHRASVSSSVDTFIPGWVSPTLPTNLQQWNPPPPAGNAYQQYDPRSAAGGYFPPPLPTPNLVATPFGRPSGPNPTSSLSNSAFTDDSLARRLSISELRRSPPTTRVITDIVSSSNSPSVSAGDSPVFPHRESYPGPDVSPVFDANSPSSSANTPPLATKRKYKIQSSTTTVRRKRTDEPDDADGSRLSQDVNGKPSNAGPSASPPRGTTAKRSRKNSEPPAHVHITNVVCPHPDCTAPVEVDEPDEPGAISFPCRYMEPLSGSTCPSEFRRRGCRDRHSASHSGKESQDVAGHRLALGSARRLLWETIRLVEASDWACLYPPESAWWSPGGGLSDWNANYEYASNKVREEFDVAVLKQQAKEVKGRLFAIGKEEPSPDTVASTSPPTLHRIAAVDLSTYHQFSRLAEKRAVTFERFYCSHSKCDSDFTRMDALVRHHRTCHQKGKKTKGKRSETASED